MSGQESIPSRRKPDNAIHTRTPSIGTGRDPGQTPQATVVDVEPHTGAQHVLDVMPECLPLASNVQRTETRDSRGQQPHILRLPGLSES